MVTALFYIGDYSQQEIADFLELPVTTVKKRLFDSRKKLREGMEAMVRDNITRETTVARWSICRTGDDLQSSARFVYRKVKQDRYVIAAILYGSLSHDTVWRKSDIDMMLVGRDDKPAA